MNIGMTLPVMEPGLTRDNLYEWTNQIDKGPWSSIALGERIVFDNPEFISMLSAVAAWTKKVEIISTVSVLSMHDPVLSAKQFATIDMLSEGRLTVGVGVGGRQEDYEAIGSDWKNHRWKKVSEYSKIMQSIWASEFEQDIGPKPVQAKGPKILAGAIGPKALSMSADYASGIAGFSFNADIEEISDAAVRAREAFSIKGMKEPRIVTSFWFAIGKDSRLQMQSHLKRYLAWMGKEIAENLAANAGFCGSIEDLSRLIKQVKECGVDDLLLVPTSKDLKQVIEIEDIL